MKNQTTIEKKIYKNWKKSVFYIENKLMCFNSVMGKNFYEYFFSLKFNDFMKGRPLMKKYVEIVKKNENEEIVIEKIDLENFGNFYDEDNNENENEDDNNNNVNKNKIVDKNKYEKLEEIN